MPNLSKLFKNLNYINTLDLLKKTKIQANGKNAIAAIVRSPDKFKVETGDNPYMQKTLKEEQQYIKTGLDKLMAAAKEKPLSNACLEQQEGILKAQFQQELSKKVRMEHQALLVKIKEKGIPVFEIKDDQGELANGKIDFYTDSVFATDVGQYFTDADGVLHYIKASFKNKQRQGEERLAIEQAENFGAQVHDLNEGKSVLSNVVPKLSFFSDKKIYFEGGDIRQMIDKKLFFVGHGKRTSLAAAEQIAQLSDHMVVPIEILQEEFYHLDCFFMPLPNDVAIVYEGEYELENGVPKLDTRGWPIIKSGTETMPEDSRAYIRAIYSDEKLILISKEEAQAFATNAVLLQHPQTKAFSMFINGASDGHLKDEKEALEDHEISCYQSTLDKIKTMCHPLQIVETPFSTFHTSGGSVRCTVLELNCTKKKLDHILDVDASNKTLVEISATQSDALIPQHSMTHGSSNKKQADVVSFFSSSARKATAEAADIKKSDEINMTATK